MSIYPDKKAGRLTGRFCIEVQKGSRRLRSRCDTYALAQAKEAELLKALEAGEEVPSSRRFSPKSSRPETLSEAIQKAKGRLWHGSTSETTNYRRLWVVAEVLGASRPVDAITTEDVDNLIVTLSSRELSDATVNRYLSAFHKFLTWCEERDYRTAKLPSFSWRDEDEGRIRWITPDEEVLLYSKLREDIPLLVKAAIQTGMRRSELLSLELPQVTQGWAHLWETKSSTPRSVPLTPESHENLTWLIRNERMPNASQLRWAWDQARKAMGLADDPWFVFHACRHTCATRYVQANVNLRVIQKLMGHKRIETTLRYAHVNDTMLTDALKTLVEHNVQSSHPRTEDGDVISIVREVGDVLLVEA